MADGAARQAAGLLAGAFPQWELQSVELTGDGVVPQILEGYRQVVNHTWFNN